MSRFDWHFISIVGSGLGSFAISWDCTVSSSLYKPVIQRRKEDLAGFHLVSRLVLALLFFCWPKKYRGDKRLRTVESLKRGKYVYFWSLQIHCIWLAWEDRCDQWKWFMAPIWSCQVHWNKYFYHGCNILTNQIAQMEVDKSLIKPTRELFINLRVGYACLKGNSERSKVSTRARES